MNPDIERLAKEAGLIAVNQRFTHGAAIESCAKFAALIAEEAACIAYGQADESHPMCNQSITARAIGKAIRAKFPAPKGDA